MALKNRTFMYLLALLFLTLFAAQGLAQGSFSQALTKEPFYPGEILKFTAEPDSAGTIFTPAFSLSKYDGFHWGVVQDTIQTDTLKGYWNSNRQPFVVEYEASSAEGSPKISIYVQGNFDSDSTDSGWANVDTVVADLTSESAAIVDIDLNNTKRPYYRFKIVGEDLGRDDQSIIYRQYLYHNDRN